MLLTAPSSLNPHLFNFTLYSRILSLWFSGLSLPASAPAPAQFARWFGDGASPQARAAFDSGCSEATQEALRSIGPDKFILPKFRNQESDHHHYSDFAIPFVAQLDAEKEPEMQAKTGLGLVLLLDQLPRNIFRQEQKLIYSHYDRISRAVSHEIYARGLDSSEIFRRSPPWRMWFYIPLMHSEALVDHEVFERILGEMTAEAQKAGDDAAEGYIGRTRGFEQKHVDILRKFGRYPHRNKVLDRQSTPEEQDWLEAGGDTFGT